jgi:hypothetical protein
MQKIIATWVYCSPENEKIIYWQVGEKSDSAEFQNVYWRCVFCLFESSHRLNSNVEHILFINQYPPSEIDGISINSLIYRYGINIVTLTDYSIPPAEYSDGWNSQFFVLDIIGWLAEKYENSDAILILLDSDCIFNKPIDYNFINDAKENGALLYSIDYPEDYKINGLSRFDLKKLAIHYSGLRLNSFVYNGGEFFCATSKVIKGIAREAREAYEASIKRNDMGLQKFNEEAHLLSYVYHKLGFKTHTANKYIRRIYTNRFVTRTVDGFENDLTIWHLLSEKKRGFVEMFRTIGNGRKPPNMAKMFHIEEDYFTICKAYAIHITNKMYHRLIPIAKRLFLLI